MVKDMKTILVLLTGFMLLGCTVFRGVTDVKQTQDELTVEKCDLTVYLALYGLVTSTDNCRREVMSTK